MTGLADLGGWPAVLGALTARQELSPAQASAGLRAILAGEATSAQIAGFIVGLRVKGETSGELGALLATLVEVGEQVPIDPAGLIDTCGTGGDRSHSINVSTLAAIVAVGAGARACKHGNRAASSACGSADLLEALGVAIELGPGGVARCVQEARIGFCFARRFHPAMRHVGPVRGELGVATAFNVLGPIANPAGVRRQVVGVSDPALADRVLDVLAARGAEHVLVVHGGDGLDELTTTTTSTVHEYRAGERRSYTVDPAALGLSRATLDDLRGGDAATNAAHARAVLGGASGPHREVVLLNAAAGLLVAGLAADLAQGISLAAASIDDGRAAAVLERFVQVSQAEQAAITGE